MDICDGRVQTPRDFLSPPMCPQGIGRGDQRCGLSQERRVHEFFIYSQGESECGFGVYCFNFFVNYSRVEQINLVKQFNEEKYKMHTKKIHLKRTYDENDY